MATPAKMPFPVSTCCRANNTSYPNPPAPIKAATTTIDRLIMMDWLMPVMMEGMARGISTLNRSWRGFAPNDTAASRTECGTCMIPKAVNRIKGGMANTIVARIPGGFPIEKKATAGIR